MGLEKRKADLMAELMARPHCGVRVRDFAPIRPRRINFLLLSNNLLVDIHFRHRRDFSGCIIHFTICLDVPRLLPSGQWWYSESLALELIKTD